MEEQTSWKGHTFTLLVFAGIVFLCSVFFVLGMLVGQGQGRSAADAATVASASKAATAAATSAPNPTSESPSPIAPFEGVPTGSPISAVTPKETKEDVPDPPSKAPPPAPVRVPDPAPVKARPAPASLNMSYLQVTASGKEATARKLVDDLNKQGFSAIMTSGDADKLFHVKVGPFSNNTDLATAKRKLEALGYQAIRK